MFHSPMFRSGTIISDEGFRVILKTRYELEYQDSQGMIVSLNYDAVFPSIDLLVLSFSASQGDTSVAVDPAQKATILEHISSALQWKGYEVKFVESR